MAALAEKLLSIQAELKVPKNQYNSFGNYNYRSCEDILEGLKPLLTEYKATLTISDEIVQIGDRYYVKATATLADIEKDMCIETTAYAREDESKKGMDLAQVTGSTSSYARKYALNGLFAIDDTKDSDYTNTHGKAKDKPSKPVNNPKTDGEVKLYCSSCGTVINQNVASYSKQKFGRVLCMNCQKKEK
ncbi:ERF family protein [Anaerosalibacter sp. Marseille-P3206]|uniref:ERF family protein n=1 Tax=Anaerosalibacter sp. Marseille-P3206 TaxID=1871005 RepID=UPI000985D1CB|nr:ERF family protein [Anaerosalibacter sp. Marseille-P3206]